MRLSSTAPRYRFGGSRTPRSDILPGPGDRRHPDRASPGSHSTGRSPGTRVDWLAMPLGLSQGKRKDRIPGMSRRRSRPVASPGWRGIDLRHPFSSTAFQPHSACWRRCSMAQAAIVQAIASLRSTTGRRAKRVLVWINWSRPWTTPPHRNGSSVIDSPAPSSPDREQDGLSDPGAFAVRTGTGTGDLVRRAVARSACRAPSSESD